MAAVTRVRKGNARPAQDYFLTEQMTNNMFQNLTDIKISKLTQ